MMRLSREEYMNEVGTTQEEQNDLKELTFETFINLKVGDIVYDVNDWDYFIKVPFKVTYSKWLKSPDGVYKRNYESFYYKQISFVRGSKKLYADSCSHNYHRGLYVRSSLFNELLDREQQRKNKNRRKIWKSFG